MGPPDRGHHRALDPFDGRRLLLQLADQTLHQLLLIGSRASEGASSQQALAGGSGGEKEGEALDSLGCGHRWVQKGLMFGGGTPAAPLPSCPDGIDVQQVTTGHDGLDRPGVTDVGKRIPSEDNEVGHFAGSNQS